MTQRSKIILKLIYRAGAENGKWKMENGELRVESRESQGQTGVCP